MKKLEAEPEPERAPEPERKPEPEHANEESETFAEPAPPFDKLKNDLGVVWDLKIVFLCALYALVIMVCARIIYKSYIKYRNDTKRSSRNALPIIQYTFVMVFALSRFLNLSTNPYQLDPNAFVSAPIAELFWDVGFSALAGSFTIVLISLILASRGEAVKLTLCRGSFILLWPLIAHGIIVLSKLMGQVLFPDSFGTTLLVIGCQAYYIIWSTCISSGYLRFGRRIVRTFAQTAFNESSTNMASRNEPGPKRISRIPSSQMTYLPGTEGKATKVKAGNQARSVAAPKRKDSITDEKAQMIDPALKAQKSSSTSSDVQGSNYRRFSAAASRRSSMEMYDDFSCFERFYYRLLRLSLPAEYRDMDFSRVQPKFRRSLSKMYRLTTGTAIVAITVGLVSLFGLLAFLRILPIDFTDSWPWFIYQFIFRLLELLMAAIIIQTTPYPVFLFCKCWANRYKRLPTNRVDNQFSEI